MPGSEHTLIARLGAAPDPATLGGKGASLDRLLRLGFRVPPGFALTTAAFEAQRSAVAGDAAAMASGPLVEAVAAPLRAALSRLVAELEASGIAGPRFAVRSSAIGEDGFAASFAGLHETELDLAADDVPGAVARCWASLWSPAALAYRERRGLPVEDAAMAVVVQALVPADAAAVVFTYHPVTGRDDQLVVTAVRGLGDAMVAGTVTPDTYVVERASRAVVDASRGDDPEAAIDAAALDALVDLALDVEARLGAPVDIEAAVAAGSWYLLQARPITTLAASR